jgi:hypothetical protein
MVLTAKIILIIAILHLSCKTFSNKSLHLMKLDKSKYQNKCNDYLDRLIIEINFMNETQLTNVDDQEQIFLFKYRTNKNCSTIDGDSAILSNSVSNQIEKDCEKFKTLTTFSFDNNIVLRTIIDSFYKYQFQIVQMKNENQQDKQNSETVICKHLDFIQLDHCDLIKINVTISQKECNIINKNRSNSFNLIPFVYATILILLALTITLKLGKIVFNKYRRI